jgi:hypothetical protein
MCRLLVPCNGFNADDGGWAPVNPAESLRNTPWVQIDPAKGRRQTSKKKIMTAGQQSCRLRTAAFQVPPVLTKRFHVAERMLL